MLKNIASAAGALLPLLPVTDLLTSGKLGPPIFRGFLFEMPAVRAYREVVPNDSVLFEEVLEALRESQLATAVEAREAEARDQDCHVATERLTASSELNATATGLASFAIVARLQPVAAWIRKCRTRKGPGSAGDRPGSREEKSPDALGRRPGSHHRDSV
jgi:hypothetical protein